MPTIISAAVWQFFSLLGAGNLGEGFNISDLSAEYITQTFEDNVNQIWLNDLFLKYIKQYGPGTFEDLTNVLDKEIKAAKSEFLDKVRFKLVAEAFKDALLKFASQRCSWPSLQHDRQEKHCDWDGNIIVKLRFTGEDVIEGQGVLFDDDEAQGGKLSTTLKYVHGTIFVFVLDKCDGYFLKSPDLGELTLDKLKKTQHNPAYIFTIDEMWYFDGKSIHKVKTIPKRLKEIKEKLRIIDADMDGQPKELTKEQLSIITSVSGHVRFEPTTLQYPPVNLEECPRASLYLIPGKGKGAWEQKSGHRVIVLPDIEGELLRGDDVYIGDDLIIKKEALLAALAPITANQNVIDFLLQGIDQNIMQISDSQNLINKAAEGPTKKCPTKESLHLTQKQLSIVINSAGSKKKDAVRVTIKTCFNCIRSSNGEEGLCKDEIELLSFETSYIVSPTEYSGMQGVRLTVDSSTLTIDPRAAQFMHKKGIDIFACAPTMKSINLYLDRILKKFITLIQSSNETSEGQLISDIAKLMYSYRIYRKDEKAQEEIPMTEADVRRLEQEIRDTKQFDSLSIDELFCFFDKIESFCKRFSIGAQQLPPSVKQLCTVVQQAVQKTALDKLDAGSRWKKESTCSYIVANKFKCTSSCILSNFIFSEPSFAVAEVLHATLVEPIMKVAKDSKDDTLRKKLAWSQQSCLLRMVLKLQRTRSLTAEACKYLDYVAAKTAEYGLNSEYVANYGFKHVCKAIASELKRYLKKSWFVASDRKERVDAVCKKLLLASAENASAEITTLPQLYQMLSAEMEGIFTADRVAHTSRRVIGKSRYFATLDRCLSLIGVLCSKDEMDECSRTREETLNRCNDIEEKFIKAKFKQSHPQEQASKDGKAEPHPKEDKGGDELIPKVIKAESLQWCGFFKRPVVHAAVPAAPAAVPRVSPPSSHVSSSLMSSIRPN